MNIKFLEDITVSFRDHSHYDPENLILREIKKGTYYSNVTIIENHIVHSNGDIFYGVPGRFYKIYKQ